MALFEREPNYHISLLAELHKDNKHTEIVLYSDGKSEPIHSLFLGYTNTAMKDLLTSSKSNLLILPDFSAVLPDLVTLIYTGKTPGLTEQKLKLLISLCEEFGMNTSVINNASHYNLDESNKEHNHLKIETEINSVTTDEKFCLRMPESRIEHNEKSLNVVHTFNGFKGRVQTEYNSSPIGPYQGPYDQDPAVPLSAQLLKSPLSFAKYTNFKHPEKISCKIFKVKPITKACDNLERIALLEIKEDSKNKFNEPDDKRKIFYTCKKKYCEIPCPCHACCSDSGQCSKHNICHPDLFDEEDHLFSVRSTEPVCTEKDFFRFSYVLRYPGISKTCLQCKIDLLDHKSYHLKFHWTCKFCRLYQYKLYPKSVKALHEREKQEQKWYKSVCPYCNKKFIEQYQKKKHVELEHKKNKLKCDECAKSFQCPQSLDYHKLSKHTTNARKSHNCSICHKSFLAKVTLNNHIKYMHTNERKFECSKCDSKFKQRKHLNEHSKKIHDFNPRQEDYWQDLRKKIFQCENCSKNFSREVDFKAHVKAKHSNLETFTCDLCPNVYKHEKNLRQHKLEKHGPEINRYECPECGKMFNHKRNLERHRLSHVKTS